MPNFLLAQNCKIVVATNKVCLGNTLLFTATFNAGLTATSYSWNFGNAATSAQASPVYQFPLRGKFVPILTINFSNATSCTVSGDTIQVVDNPKANFNVTTSLTQCFNKNLSCMDDISTVGLDNAPIVSRVFLYGDGGFSNQAPGTGNTICYSYPNPLGGVYTMVLEVTDANNCLSRKERINHVTVYSKMQEVSFKTTYSTQCGKTPALFTNTSKIPISQVAKYTWDFGDGSTATSPWTGFTRIYSITGKFTAKLAVEDKNGCRDTAVVYPAAENYLIDSTIYLNSIGMCYNGNGFRVRSNNHNGYVGLATVWWAFYKVGNSTRVDTSISNVHAFNDIFWYSDSINFNECGEYQIRMYVKLGNCFIRRDTTVKVFGPKSVIETRADPIINSIQCEVNDTVLFRTPVGDRSCFYNNGALYRLWDFDDAFAPNCTTDTKNGINVGVNCRYSRDSIAVRHAYKKGEDRCYLPKLILTDLVSGCTDTSMAAMKLTAPDAGWDSTVTPIRKGLYYVDKKPCLDNVISFLLDQTLPLCGREVAWIMPDSICPGATWRRIDTFDNIFNHVYTSTCNPNGFVTVGLIIKNGKDKNGKDCYDTAWYHNFLKFYPINPIFSVVRTNTGCRPFMVKATMADSIQDSLKQVVFNFNSTGGTRTINFGPNDSIIPSQYYTFTTPGIKKVSISITNTRGCIKTVDQFLYFGYYRNFAPAKPVICLYDSAELIDDIYYYNDLSKQFWRDSLRANAGKEQVYWDFGDGKGFITTGGLPKYKYSRIGNYRLRMVTVDSIGCRDTLTFGTTLKVVDISAIIKPMQARYLCAPQILSFVDQSLYFDSSSLFGQSPYDTIKFWNWSFGDNKLFSLFKNPVHDYTANGTYIVKMVIQTQKGCIDSAEIPIWIDGPRPKFTILSDTVGCAPFKLTLSNTTGYPLSNWVWYFRDQNNATASTQLDTNVSHTYTKGGIYKIYLVGEDTIFNPFSGQYKTCVSVFPDSMNVNAPRRVIRVIDAIGAKLEAPDSVCLGVPFNLIARPNQLVPGFAWLYGDTSKYKQTLYPDTIVKHTYYTLGSFNVRMYPISSSAKCTDTAQKVITVSSVKADFDMDESSTPLIKFTNKSTSAVRYEWDFGHPLSGSKNFSTEVNPSHLFIGGSGSYTVCLKAFNSQDCYDSVCKKTEPANLRLNIPNVFTPNNDGNNDAYDIDIVGYTIYDLTIYNRWGNKVFETNKDGFSNDGKNWNGKNFNVGEDCPEGVYFFVFQYQMINQNSPKFVNGTITLLREE
jgi:gliding motility-associated-like protein